jgi:ABC-type transporter Mla MlaB component
MAKKQATSPVAEAPQVHSKDSVYTLDANFEIQNLEDTRRDLIETLGRGLPVTVDVSRVASVDTAGVQLLIALRNAAPKHGVSVEFRGESAALSNALLMLGLQDAIPLAPAHEGR